MTLIPFSPRHARSLPGNGPPLPADAAATGTFCSPSGRAGTFTGTYRLERFLSQFGQLASAGVFTGELTDADGMRIGMGSRRHTAAIEVVASPEALIARLGPVDVNLLGFLVQVAEITMNVDRASARIADAMRVSATPPGNGGPLASVSELVSRG